MLIVQQIFNNIDNKLVVPTNMGSATPNQLAGSPLDNLVELAGRTCYDSLGAEKSRDSVSYHKHIVEVGHGSVQEHSNLTISFWNPWIDISAVCMNRPGVSVGITRKNPEDELLEDYPRSYRVTANLRAIREWDILSEYNNCASRESQAVIGNIIKSLVKEKAPLVLYDQDIKIPEVEFEHFQPKIETPIFAPEYWISFYFAGVSRGFSHELVRHKWRTAVSQRSTRYVDESQTDWSWHPLLCKYRKDVDSFIRQFSGGELTQSVSIGLQDLYTLPSAGLRGPEEVCRFYYDKLVEFLQAKLIDEGIDKFSARKQARGAARGILGNALSTELIFSASLDQWQRIINQRCSDFADAEIRLAISKVFESLCDFGFLDRDDYTVRVAKDGIGNHITLKGDD